MNGPDDITLHIRPKEAEIVVEQFPQNGVISRKTISPETLCACILGSRYDEKEHFTGLLPENCVAAVVGGRQTEYFIRCPELYADISYYGTQYLHFPIPRLVFAFRYLPKEGKVAQCRLCVVKDERLAVNTPTYRYPFSNLHGDKNICIGNNALPVFKDPSRLHTLVGYLLRLPNNDDLYSAHNNRLHVGYRDLLELLKDKTPDFYYSDILVKDGKTLKDFLNGR